MQWLHADNNDDEPIFKRQVSVSFTIFDLVILIYFLILQYLDHLVGYHGGGYDHVGTVGVGELQLHHEGYRGL